MHGGGWGAGGGARPLPRGVGGGVVGRSLVGGGGGGKGRVEFQPSGYR